MKTRGVAGCYVTISMQGCQVIVSMKRWVHELAGFHSNEGVKSVKTDFKVEKAAYQVVSVSGKQHG